MRPRDDFETGSRQHEPRSAPIGGIRGAMHQAAPFETLHDPTHRARVQVQQCSKATRRQAWKAANKPEGEALRPGDAHATQHPLRSALQRMIELPKRAQKGEIEAEVRFGLDPRTVFRRLGQECQPGRASRAEGG